MKVRTDWESQIQQLCVLSKEMLELAQASAWEIVTEREKQRCIVLDELFRDPLPAEWAPRLRDAVQATLASDAQVQALAHTEMDRISDDLRTLKQGRRALQAYHDG